MADYNSTTNMPPQCEGTKLVPRTGIMERVASNGKVRLRAKQSANKYDPIINHGVVTATQLSAFKAFYLTNRTATFTFTANEDGVQRTCVFSPEPFDVDPMPGQQYKLVVRMREV
jgi:hypothetical protein